MIKKLLIGFFALILPSCAQEQITLDLPALVAQANRYQLPKPPPEAKPILAKTAWTTVGNSSVDLDPALYEPGFHVGSNPDKSAKVLIGFHHFLSHPGRAHQPAIRSFSAIPTKPKLGGYVFRGNSQATFETAIQLARRGDFKTAQTLFENFYRSEYKDTDLNALLDHFFPKNAHLLLALTTFDYHYRHLRKKSADLKNSLTILAKLQAEFPSLLPNDKKVDFFGYRRTAFLNDLRLTVKSPAPKPGSIEDLIYQSAYLNVSSHMRKPDHPIFKIYLQGTTAISELVRLSTSRKLTPAIQPAIMNSREKRLRLGHLATAILEDMTGVLAPGKPKKGHHHFYTLDDRWKPWLTKARLTDEKSFFLSALGKVEKPQEHDVSTPLYILLQKYPETTLELADRFAKSKKRSLFISTLVDSELDQHTKIKALKKVAQYQKKLDRRQMLQALAKLRPGEAAQELLPLLKSLPKDVKEPYWTAQEANLTHVVMQLDDLTIWKAYLAKAKTCSIGLRMEFMNPMNYSYIDEKNKTLRLAFLAAFLNDTEVRTVKQTDKRWEGPHAGFTYDSLSVQNFVAEKIASILGLPGEPGDHWTKTQWTPYRKKVEAALVNINLPDLSE